MQTLWPTGMCKQKTRPQKETLSLSGDSESWSQWHTHFDPQVCGIQQCSTKHWSIWTHRVTMMTHRINLLWCNQESSFYWQLFFNFQLQGGSTHDRHQELHKPDKVWHVLHPHLKLQRTRLSVQFLLPGWKIEQSTQPGLNQGPTLSKARADDCQGTTAPQPLRPFSGTRCCPHPACMYQCSSHLKV